MENIINKICKHLKCGFEIKLCMEDGAAWVELYNINDEQVNLPDSTDKTIIEQLNDALCVANGFALKQRAAD